VTQVVCFRYCSTRREHLGRELPRVETAWIIQKNDKHCKEAGERSKEVRQQSAGGNITHLQPENGPRGTLPEKRGLLKKVAMNHITQHFHLAGCRYGGGLLWTKYLEAVLN